MVDMTDEEVVEYVMMLSKEQDDQDAAIAASELQQIEDLEQQHMLEQRLFDEFGNGGEGSSMSIARSVSPSSARPQEEEPVTEQELDEEEELVRRAIELSMLDVELNNDDHDHHGHHHHHHHHHHHSGPSDCPDAFASDDAHSHSHQLLEWEPSEVLDVDAKVNDTHVSQEDQAIVDSILKELQDEEDQARVAIEIDATKLGTPSATVADDWPSIGKVSPTPDSTSTSSLLSSSATTTAASTSRSEPAVQPQEPAVKKMTWSMVARTNSESSLGSTGSQGKGQGPSEKVVPAGRQPAIFRQYSQSAMQEEIEDEETLLARILSLSMVEK